MVIVPKYTYLSLTSIYCLQATLLGIITAGLLTTRTGVNLVREIDGEFARNPPRFAGHYFIDFHFNQPTRDYYWRV